MQRTAWDAEAERYDEEADHGLRDPAVREAWRSLLREVLPAAPARVAEMGCGTGSLTLLLAEDGHRVDGVDVSSAMLERARVKTGGHDSVSLVGGDAAHPPFSPGRYDAVLCRHVLWALPDPVAVLRRWSDLLVPGGRLVLVEGDWHTGAGLTAERTVALLGEAGRSATVRRLREPVYWGGDVADERYLVVSADTPTEV